MNENKLIVSFHGKEVGTLSETPDHRVAFAYTPEWQKNGFPISPFSLPVCDRVFLPPGFQFDGLFGVFADSLPDAWGRLLMDRMLRNRGMDPSTVNTLTRLAIIGDAGMGALSYKPSWDKWQLMPPDDLDVLAEECQQILNQSAKGIHSEGTAAGCSRDNTEGTKDEVKSRKASNGCICDADTLFAMAGSTGGARPKVMTEEWIIKFPASTENPESGTMEKEYMDCAATCGIYVPETRLLPSKKCGGYFAVRRFDRKNNNRIHVLTAAAIRELDWRAPSLDYHTLMKLTKIICCDCDDDMEQMFRRMCFNVFAHNRDDHSKNFSYLYDELRDEWHPSPAYDLTWSTTYYGEHTTTVDGNGRNPGMKELLAVGTGAGLQRTRCKKIAEEIRDKTLDLTVKYKNTKS